ncbi:hypothetical protein NCCP2716_14060 [Sporosarcina sp. NCCP-2716]|uniref:glycine betaine ABC transporter substrate-binding protein n=1 Tax=Sporosarcina sp. NCCP-2716 TaxID=2943679 RepID=UPI00203B0A3A|nr:glycine betaine ABC transporter substrate-binding protein [Sporosarcina sp. NCCP-2716]GKV68908.1 hypothetical protein NCCP2716_14060 [Sporosarcina sp. NCCP-2716]
MGKSIGKRAGIAAALAAGLTLTACSSGIAGDEELQLGGKELNIPYNDSGSAIRSFVMAEVLKDAGYDVTLTPLEAAGTVYANASEDTDTFHASGWYPETDKEYLSEYGGNLDVYTKTNLIDQASVSLAVPEYMTDVNSIADLEKDPELAKSLNRTITGIDPRCGIMEKTDTAIEDNTYKLGTWTLKDGSERDMLAALQEALKSQTPIVIIGWTPHWAVSEMKLKLLKDPEEVFSSGEEHINLVFNKKFKDEHPAAYKIVTAIGDDWSASEEASLSKQIFVEGKDKQTVLDAYMKSHSNKVDKWQEGVAKE